MRYSLLGLFGAMGIIILAIAVILARQVLIALSPLIAVVVIATIIAAFFAAIIFAFFSALKWNDARLERFRFETRKLHPDQITGANYPAIWYEGGIVQAQSGITIQPVPHTYSPHITYPATKLTEIPEEPKLLEAPQQVSQPLMEEMYSAVKFNGLEVAFGRTVDTGSTVVQSIVQGVHFKLVGGSGFGKSCLAAALLDIATRCNDTEHLRIALLDLEYRTSRLFENLPHVFELPQGRRSISLVARDANEVALHLSLLREELDRRALSGIITPLLLVYVEEMLSLQYEVDEKLKSQMLADLAILALRGRKYGIFLLACTQTDYSTKELKEAQKQFRTRSGFAIDPSAARAAGFVNNELIKYNFQHAIPGRFLFEKPGQSSLVLAPLYDVDRKLEELANPSKRYDFSQFPGSSQVVPNQYNLSNGNYDGNQWEPVGTSEIDRQRITVIRQMLREHKSQNEIVSVVFPGMRNADAITEYRRLLAILVEQSS